LTLLILIYFTEFLEYPARFPVQRVMHTKIIAFCIMAALQPCCFGQGGGGGGGGFGGLAGAAVVGQQVTTTGTIFDPSGAPDPNVDLTVWRSSRSIGTANSDADGKYSIQWQAPSAWRRSS
jgi:hypothetical protein